MSRRKGELGSDAHARPFIKWVGGKRQLLSEILARTPKKYGVYYEPFIGGGAVFFALAPTRAVVSDANERLIRTLKGVRDDVDGVIERLSSYPYEKQFFLSMRDRDIDAANDAEMAAWFVYLNRSCFNGLYRVNRKGRFNVPFGRYTNPRLCDPENLRACSAALLRADVGVAPFEAVLDRAERGDFVYFDPPYVPLSATSSFTSYTSNGFDMASHERLRDVAVTLRSRGVHVLISNSSAPFVRNLYSGFRIDEVYASRSVNSKASARGKIVELLISG